MLDRIQEARLRVVSAKEDLEEANRHYMKVFADMQVGEGEETIDLGVKFDDGLIMQGVKLDQFGLSPIYDEHLFGKDQDKVRRFKDETARCDREVRPLVRQLLGLWFTGRQADLAEQGGGLHFQFVAYLIELLFKSAMEQGTALSRPKDRPPRDLWSSGEVC